MPPALVFLLSGAAVAAAGTRLARDGDRLGEETGLGGLWVGAILVAAATSLPELLTDLSAIRQGNPGLAIGDLFGSSMANMMILALADLVLRRGSILGQASMTQVLIGVLAICLTAVAAVGVMLQSRDTVLGMGMASLGLVPLVIGATYLAGMRLLHRNRPSVFVEGAPEKAPPRRVPWRRVRRPVIGFTLAVLVILAAAPFLASSAADLSVQLGLDHGFAGMVLLAFTTSLPELAVTFTSVRVGAYSLAVGNLLGSNCFNMAAIVPLDVANGPAPLLGTVDPTLAVAALMAILMMGLALLDVLNRSARSRFALEPGPALLALTYFAGLYVVFRLGH